MSLENNIIGLKTGSRNLVYTTELGTIISPSCIAVERHLDGTPKEYIIGNPNHINNVYPLNRGIITATDKLSAEENKQLLIKILEHTKIPKFSRIVCAAPESEMESGKGLLKEAIIKALSPDKELILYPECFCGAVAHMGVDKAVNDFFSVLNLGSTSVGIGIFSAGEKKLLTSFTDTSGYLVDERILIRLNNIYGSLVTNITQIQNIKEKFNMKIEPQFSPIDIIIGKEQKTISCDTEIRYELDLYAKEIADIYTRIFTSPNSNDFRYNMIKSPLVLTGGMSNIIGLSEIIKMHIDNQINSNIELHVVENGHISPAIGAFKLAKELFI